MIRRMLVHFAQVVFIVGAFGFTSSSPSDREPPASVEGCNYCFYSQTGGPNGNGEYYYEYGTNGPGADFADPECIPCDGIFTQAGCNMSFYQGGNWFNPEEAEGLCNTGPCPDDRVASLESAAVLVENKDAVGLAALLQASSWIRLNAERMSVQGEGCGRSIVMNLPIDDEFVIALLTAMEAMSPR